MDKGVLVQKYIEKSNKNFELYEFLAKENKFLEWQAVSIFYSALCYIKAYLFSKPSMPDNCINSHWEIKDWLVKEVQAKRLMIYENYYSFLYNMSRDARYKCKEIKISVINKMLEKYNEIKRLLPID